MIKQFIIFFACACQSLFSIAQPLNVEPSLAAPQASRPARVVIVQDAAASQTFNPRPEVIQKMVDRAITNLTGTATVASAWSSLVSTQDTIGIKVFSGPGRTSGTRPAVVAAVVQGLLEANVPPRKIIIWDKQIFDLRLAGFFDLAERFGVRVVSSASAGYDEKTPRTTRRLSGS